MKKSSFDRYFTPKALIRIIFPEVQLVDHIREVGIINKDYFSKKVPAEVKAAAAAAVHGKASNFQTHSKPSGGGLVSSAVNGASSIARSVHIYNNKKNLSSEQIDIVFENIEAEMKNYVLEQEELIRGLCIAFKRPYINPQDKSYSNLFFIIGGKGTGRHLSIDVMTRLLRDKGLFSRGSVCRVDLSKYMTEKDCEQLFIPDLYRVLYGMDSVVVFDNVDKCHENALEKITNLAINGSLKLDKRYFEQLGRMTEVTGSLMVSATEELQANGKYLIFVTERKMEYLQNKFSSQMISAIPDIIECRELTDKAFSTITRIYLKDCMDKVNKNLTISLNFDPSVNQNVLNGFDRSSGAFGIQSYINLNIYNPMVELSLKEKIQRNDRVTIDTEQGSFFLKKEGISIDLGLVLAKRETDSIEKLDRDLDKIVGLDSVKKFIHNLEDNLKIQKARESMGEKSVQMSLHMVFTGNPGTGKTTMARLISKYLKALGYLSSGHLVETARADLVGQYIGETAQKTMAKINSALGGVLFIDEAYSLVRDKNDIFGVEAIDTLVKAMEDNRNNLVVILAGYTDEMEQFIKTNPGLRSRFNYFVEFSDYTASQLLQILKINAESLGYRIDSTCDNPLIDYFERMQIPGKNDSGNGRLARNVLEKAQINCTERFKNMDLSKISKDQLNTLIPGDFGLDEKPPINLDERLSKIVGLDEVKDFVKGLQKQLIAEDKRKKAGIKVDDSQTLNMIFTGNPGTGKTTIARLIAELMKDLGVLKSGQLVETSKNDYVSEYAGETAKKTEEVFKKALGGVLFIDEAYSLADGALGQEAIDTLVKLIEDHRKDIVVILAGYEKEMQRFLEANSGLASRFPLKIHFPDYSLKELAQIAVYITQKKGYTISEFGMAGLQAQISRQQSSGGNGRLVRNIVEKAVRFQSSRVAELNNANKEQLVTLEKEDFIQEHKDTEMFDLEKALDDVVGLKEAKDFMRSLQAQIVMQKKRRELGLVTKEQQTLHMIFKGNPGTGKTTMARIVGKILYNLGVLSEDKLIETDRSGLVAGYVGQTAIKTKEVIQSAYNGILFIDEAYSLSSGGDSDFGKEAIDTLVKEMDDNRDKLVVILAGYDKEMDDFLDMNSGLKSRFPNIISFNDYDVDELMLIAQRQFESEGYSLSDKAKDKLVKLFIKARKDSNFGNGRYVRNVVERTKRNLDSRLISEQNLTKEMLTTITADDIRE